MNKKIIIPHLFRQEKVSYNDKLNDLFDVQKGVRKTLHYIAWLIDINYQKNKMCFAYIKQDTLASRLKCSRATINRRIKILSDLGFIIVSKEKTKTNKYYTTNAIFFYSYHETKMIHEMKHETLHEKSEKILAKQLPFNGVISDPSKPNIINNKFKNLYKKQSNIIYSNSKDGSGTEKKYDSSFYKYLGEEYKIFPKTGFEKTFESLKSRFKLNDHDLYLILKKEVLSRRNPVEIKNTNAYITGILNKGGLAELVESHFNKIEQNEIKRERFEMSLFDKNKREEKEKQLKIERENRLKTAQKYSDDNPEKVIEICRKLDLEYNRKQGTIYGYYESKNVLWVRVVLDKVNEFINKENDEYWENIAQII